MKPIPYEQENRDKERSCTQEGQSPPLIHTGTNSTLRNIEYLFTQKFFCPLIS